MTSESSSFFYDSEGNPIEDPYHDITCSDTDCSWMSEDSDYTSIFTLFEEEMEPTKWMVKFNKWLKGGNIYDNEESGSGQSKGTDEENDDDNDDDYDEKKEVESIETKSICSDTASQASATLSVASGICTPSKYAIVKGTEGSNNGLGIQLEEMSPRQNPPKPIQTRISYRRQRWNLNQN